MVSKYAIDFVSGSCFTVGRIKETEGTLYLLQRVSRIFGNSVAGLGDILLPDESEEVVQYMGKRTVVIFDTRSIPLAIGKIVLG